MLEITGDLFLETYRILRGCGEKDRECQVVWLSCPSHPDKIVEVRHSTHISERYGLIVDNGWLNKLWRELATKRLAIRAQVHTHAEDAFHSETDDTYPIIGTPGFVSIVVPRYGFEQPSVDALYVTEIKNGGGWEQRRPKEALRVT